MQIHPVEVHIRLRHPALQQPRVRRAAVVGPQADGKEKFIFGRALYHRVPEPAVLVHPDLAAIVGKTGQRVKLILCKLQAVLVREPVYRGLQAVQMGPQRLFGLCFRYGVTGLCRGAVTDAPHPAAEVSLGAEALVLFDTVDEIIAGHHLRCREDRNRCGWKHHQNHGQCQKRTENPVSHGILPPLSLAYWYYNRVDYKLQPLISKILHFCYSFVPLILNSFFIYRVRPPIMTEEKFFIPFLTYFCNQMCFLDFSPRGCYTPDKAADCCLQ